MPIATGQANPWAGIVGQRFEKLESSGYSNDSSLTDETGVQSGIVQFADKGFWVAQISTVLPEGMMLLRLEW